MKYSTIISKVILVLSLTCASIFGMENSRDLDEQPEREYNLNEVFDPEIWSYIAEFLPANDLFLRETLLHRIPLKYEDQIKVLNHMVNSIQLRSITDIEKILNFIQNNPFDSDITEYYLDYMRSLLDAAKIGDPVMLQKCLSIRESEIDGFANKFTHLLRKKASFNLKCIILPMQFLAVFIVAFGIVVGAGYLWCLNSQCEPLVEEEINNFTAKHLLGFTLIMFGSAFVYYILETSIKRNKRIQSLA